MKHYDVLVIGSGGGTKIAGPAAEQGYRVALVEEDAMGGTCLNRGCIPSKMLIYPADLMHHIAAAAEVDVQTGGAPRLDFPSLVRRVTATVDEISEEQLNHYASLPGLDLYRARARFVEDKVVEIDGERLAADRIFIATGTRPTQPDIPGLAGTPFMTSREALRTTERPDRMLVLGAGFIACELGHVYGAAGTDVHFLVRSELLRHEDGDIKAEFSRAFSRHHTIHQGVVPSDISFSHGRFTVSLTGPAGEATMLDADALLVAAGVRPNTDDLGLEHTQIDLSPEGYIRVDATLKTAVDGVYALGDCIGRHFYRHTVNYEGEYLVRTQFPEPTAEPIDYGPVPHAVFTYPQVAGVGSTEEELTEQRFDFVAGIGRYAGTTAGMARKAEVGLVKLLVARGDGRLLGAHVLGDEASDMIHMLIAFMKMRGTLDDLLDTIYIHPALPEAVRDAARDARKRCHSGR